MTVAIDCLLNCLRIRVAVPFAVLFAGLCVVLCGCAGDSQPMSPRLEVHFAALEAGGCEKGATGTGKIPENVSTLAAVIQIGSASSDIQRTSVSKLEGGRWVIGPLPTSDKADVVVYGCDASGKVVYQGRSNGSPVPEQGEANVRMFLVPVGKLACTGHKAVNSGKGESDHLTSARSFATSTAFPNGDVLVAGGIGDWEGDAKKGIGSLDTDVYEHDGGHFRKGPALLEKRIWHHVIALDDRRALVAGGVGEVSAVGALPSPLMAPANIGAALPKTKAEVIDVIADGSGTYTPSKASAADVGVGGLFMSAALRVGDSVVFAGGVASDGTVGDKATRLSGLTDVALGKAGKTESLQMNTPRVRPAMIAFDDGTVVIWGGSNAGQDAVAELGEMIAPGDMKATPVVISGSPKALADDSMIATFGPALAPLKRTADELIFVVAGGVPKVAPTNAAAVPAYLVVLGKDGKASLKELDLGGQKLHAGLGAGVAQLTTGQGVIVGGLIGLSGVKPCEASAPECLMSTGMLLQAPTSVDGDKVAVTANLIALGGPRAGISVTALPAGALLAGGQGSAVDATQKGVASLDPSGRVIAGAMSAADDAKICGK